MKETIVGLQEALDKRGIKISVGPGIKPLEALKKANEIDLKIEELEDQQNDLYRKEKKHYYARLKLAQAVGQLLRARRVILGFKERKTLKEIEDEIKIEMGFKNE